MNKDSLSRRWSDLQEFYLKRLPYAFIVPLLVASFLFMLGSYFPLAEVTDVVVISLFCVWWVFHLNSVRKSQAKPAFGDQLIRLERWRLFLFVFSILTFIVYFLAIEELDHTGFKMTKLPVPFNQIASFFVIWFYIFIMFLLLVTLHRFQTPYALAKLCFRETLSRLEKNIEQGTVPISDVHRCFRWLKLGFQSCNDFLIKKPYYVIVKNVEKYYDCIFSSALIGNEADLKASHVALQGVLASLGKGASEFNLRTYLVALQSVLGADRKSKESTKELIKTILVKPSLWERTKAAIKSPYTVSVIGIITLVAAILTAVLQFFHLI